MELKKTIASISITPTEGGALLNVDMPVWIKKDKNGVLYLKFPLFGDLTTFVQNESQLEQAMEEAIKSFFFASQKFGKGFDNELKSLGWQKKRNAIRFKAMPSKKFELPESYSERVPFLQDLMKTGVQKSLQVAV